MIAIVSTLDYALFAYAFVLLVDRIRHAATGGTLSNLASARPPPDAIPMTTPPRTLVMTKLYAPRLRASLVPRPNLISQLDNDPDHRLTLICAPAGYGKSTLTAQWLAKAAVPSTWVSLEASDNKTESFFSLVVTALQTIDRGLAVETEALLANQDPVPAELIVDRLIGEL